MKRLLKIFIFLLISGISGVNAQNLPVHEQYMFDYMLVNPAFTGLSEVTTFKVIHREQWIGIDDAPSTSFFLFKRRLKERAGGIGGYIYSDQNGPNSYYGAQFSASWQFMLKVTRYNRSMLSFGMSFRGLFHSLDETRFDHDLYDPIVSYGRQVTFVPNASAGAMYSHNQSFVGASFENLLPWTDRMYNMAVEPINYVIMNVHAGRIFQMKPRVQFRPSAMMKSNFHGLNQFDFNLKFNIQGGEQIHSVYLRYPHEVWFGLSYRQTLDWMNSSALSLSPAFGFSLKAFTFMYLYDLGLTSLQAFHYGTHQISIGLKFFPDEYINWGKHHVPLFTDDF